MTSNQEQRNEDAAAGTLLLLKAASSCAKKAVMASIVELVDNAAGNNGGRVPRGFIPKLIQQFASVAPGLTRHQIDHYRKLQKRSAAIMSTTSEGLTASEASTSTMSQMIVSTDDLQENTEEADPQKKRDIKVAIKREPLSSAHNLSWNGIKKLAQRPLKTTRMHSTPLQARKQSFVTSQMKRSRQARPPNMIIKDAKKRHDIEHLEIPKKNNQESNP
jgi:hypothetical protein